MGLSSVINDAVSFIHLTDDSRKRIASRLQPLREKHLQVCNEVSEDQLVLPVKETSLDCRIVGVDSGFVAKKLSNLDVLLVRAVGVVFDFEKSVLKKCSYVPGIYSFPTPRISKAGLELDEVNCSNSLVRLREEINLAKKAIEEHSPKYCFLDGSVIPQYVDRPRPDSKINEEYFSTIKAFEDLFEAAEKHNCFLLGCVEDSRGKRFVDILENEVFANNGFSMQMENVFDSSLLDYFLHVGERTFCFPYTKNASKHPVLKDFSEKWGNRIFSFYLKPAPLDRPLRVEFVSSPEKAVETANEIASVVFSLSHSHREYAYPSVLIEADLRARLHPQEIDTVYNKIIDKVAKKINLRLRRDSRPF